MPDSASRISSFVMEIFVFQIRLNYEANSPETCKSPHREPSPVSFTGSSMLGSSCRDGNGKSWTRSGCQSFLENAVWTLLLTFPPTSPRFRLRGHRVGTSEQSVEPFFGEDFSRFKYPSRGSHRV